VDKRSSVAKNAGRLSTHALTWLVPFLQGDFRLSQDLVAFCPYYVANDPNAAGPMPEDNYYAETQDSGPQGLRRREYAAVMRLSTAT
jgi:hypothetical protein